MNTDLDNILLDLEVIKQVGENDKLAVTVLPGNTKLSVDNPSLFSEEQKSEDDQDNIHELEITQDQDDDVEVSAEEILDEEILEIPDNEMLEIILQKKPPS